MKTGYTYFKGVIKNSAKAILLLLAAISLLSCSNGNSGKYSVIKGHFRQSVIETGELQAVNASFLSMPRINFVYGYQFKIIGMADYGKTVHKGEEVVKVDPSSVQKYIIEKNEALENEIASTNKLKAQITNNFQELKAQLRNEQSSYDIKKLEMEKSGFESEGIRKVIALEFRQSELKLKKIMRNLELKPRLDSLDLKIQEIKVFQKENELKAAQEDLKKMVVISPLEGIFVVEENWRTGQAIRVGDDVYLGAPVAKIPDIRSMKVKGFIMENDISRIKDGIDVLVRLDALPAVEFHGRISSLSKVCVEREDKKVFRTEILITESDLRLKPGMTVSCEYITYEGDNEIYVPSNCIQEVNKHFYVYVKKRGSIRKTEVKAGPSNNLYTIVSGDLKPGQELVPPEDIITR
jgi:multidrug efflux pump subunit AcrA (membrane-fusion protein)